MSINLRPLTVGDLFTVTDILVDAVEAGSSRIGSLLIPEASNAPVSKRGKELSREALMKAAEKQGIKTVALVLRECWKHSRRGMQEWFADLCDMPVDKFLAQPISVSLAILEYFTKNSENRDFFSRALRVVRETNESLDSFLAGLGLSDTTTDSDGVNSES